jgi:SAM-dependent methyltransferase
VSAADPERDARVVQRWNEAAGCPDTFLDHPLIQGYASLRAFGDLRSFTGAAITRIAARTRPGARLLSIGCGQAIKERQLAAALPDRTFVAIDIADRALALAREAAAAEGLRNLRIEHGDFNALALEPRAFDMVLGLGAIHHVENLEGFWEQCRRTLRPGGEVLAQEYVGPSRFQWTDLQIELGNEALARHVPAAHKVHHDRVKRIALEAVIAIDPSEAVRSSEIVPTCRAAGFEVALSGAGCGLLQPMLMHQMHTFDPRDWDHNRILFTLFAVEDCAMRERGLTDAYAMFLARPPA